MPMERSKKNVERRKKQSQRDPPTLCSKRETDDQIGVGILI